MKGRIITACIEMSEEYKQKERDKTSMDTKNEKEDQEKLEHIKLVELETQKLDGDLCTGSNPNRRMSLVLQKVENDKESGHVRSRNNVSYIYYQFLFKLTQRAPFKYVVNLSSPLFPF